MVEYTYSRSTNILGGIIMLETIVIVLVFMIIVTFKEAMRLFD